MTSRHTQPASHAPWLAAAVTLALALAAFTTLLAAPQTWVRLGVVGQVWFVVVLLLGCAIGAGAFQLTRSYATYSGKVLGGELRIGGPAVLALLVLVLGFKLAPPALQQFDFSVLVQDANQPPNPPATLEPGAKLRLDLGADRREETIGPKGEVRFVAIPATQIGRSVPVSLVDSQRFEIAPAASAAASQASTLTLSAEAVYLSLRPRQLSVPVQVLNEQGQPVPGARWHLPSLNLNGQTDDTGRLRLTLPATLPDTDNELQVQAAGYAPWRGSVTPGAGSLTVQMKAAPKARSK